MIVMIATTATRHRIKANSTIDWPFRRLCCRADFIIFIRSAASNGRPSYHLTFVPVAARVANLAPEFSAAQDVSHLLPRQRCKRPNRAGAGRRTGYAPAGHPRLSTSGIAAGWGILANAA